MSSVGKLALSVKNRGPLTPSDQTLVGVLQTKANWIWCPDTIDPGGPNPPTAPDGEQCIIRNKFFYPPDKGRPTTTTLIIAADDYLALYVDGVMIQQPDVAHDWSLMYAFQVPLPVIQNQTMPSLLLGLRGINKNGAMGLLVAVRVAYETGDSDDFYTGKSDEWRGQRLFDEGWEQPWYNSDWRPASNISQGARSPSDSLSTPTEVAVFEALPAGVSTPSTPESCQNAPTPGGWGPSPSASSQRAPIEFSVGEFAGILIGTILGAIIAGAIGAYLVLRRRNAHRSIDTWSDHGGVAARDYVLMSEPLRLPGDPNPSTPYEGSYQSPATESSPFTQMVSPITYQNDDLPPPMYSF